MLPDDQKLKICPTFSNFEFNLEKSNQIDNLEIVAEFSSDDENMEPVNNLFAESQNIFDFGGGFDSDGDNQVDLAEQKETQMLEELPNDNDEDEDGNNPFRRDHNQGLILQENEFAFLNPDVFFKNWNGSHWKFNSKPKITGNNGKQLPQSIKTHN